MWVWLRTRHLERSGEKRWRTLKVAGLYAIGALLAFFGMAALRGH